MDKKDWYITRRRAVWNQWEDCVEEACPNSEYPSDYVIVEEKVLKRQQRIRENDGRGLEGVE